MYGYSIPNMSSSTNSASTNRHFYIRTDPRPRTHCTGPCVTKSNPRDAIKCGIAHEGKFFVDKHLVFGAVNVTMVFQRISDASRFMLKCEKIQVYNYFN